MAMKASYIIYILFILLPNVVTMAQSVESDELFSKGVHLYNMKKYKEAIPIFQESDRLDKIEMDSTHNRRDYSAMWLASCHYQLGDENKLKNISILLQALPHRPPSNHSIGLAISLSR